MMFRTSTSLSAAALVAALGLSACTMPNEPMTKAAAEVSEPMSSGEILQVVHTLNQGEIAQAQLALNKSQDPEVQQTAQTIIRDHRASNQRIQKMAESRGIRLEKSPLSRGLETQASQIQDELAELSGNEFNREYLQRQVELHEIALDTVRNQLLPNAENRQINQMLQSTAPKLEQHLNAARESYASLTGSTPAG